MKWNKETKQKIDWRRLKYSFFHASRGITEAWNSQQNFRIEVGISFFIIMLSILLELTEVEWIAVVATITLVFVLELTNTSIEYLADLVKNEYNVGVRIVKDISASAVLISVLLSIIIGFVVFIPKIVAYF